MISAKTRPDLFPEWQDIPYMTGNPKIRAPGEIGLTQAQVFEIIKCIQDPIYFIENYAKIVNVDEGLIPFKPYEYQKKIMLTAIEEKYTIVKLPRQAGKALSLSTKLATPLGWTTMGQVKVGDYVIGADGKPTRVSFVTDTQYERNCFRITFDDGSTVEACADHLWTVYDRANQKRIRVNKKISNSHRKITLSTQEIYNSHWRSPTLKRGKNHEQKYQYSYYIPNCKPVEYAQVETPELNPYMLGLWLGDGTSASGALTAANDDMDFFINQTGYEVSKDFHKSVNCRTHNFYGLYRQLKNLDLLKNKHIPTSYLFAPVLDRIALLQGLMDTDGWITKSGTCHIQLTRKNEKLIDDIYCLLCSLGFKVTRKNIEKTFSTRLSFYACREDFNVARLPRKLNLQRYTATNKRYIQSRTIVNIEPIESVPVKCITVSNEDKLYLCTDSFIPTHNTTTVAGLVAWYVLFNKHFKIALLAHKESQAIEILDRVKEIYENLPLWLQQGVKIYNRKSMELENGSWIITAATSSASIRGKSLNLVYLDEFAFIPARQQEDFYTSVLPTLSSGKSTKIVITSTPKGFNLFYKIWTDAENKKNDYKHIDIHWSETPGRDEEWAREMIRNIGEEKFNQEFNTDFLGSSATLIRADKLKSIAFFDPVQFDEHLKVFNRPEKGRSYVLTADCSDGVNRDYNSFVVVDVTEIPYKVVATFRDNTLETLAYPDIIARIGKWYNDAFVVVENNNMGGEVVNALFYDLEYENLLSSSRPSAGNSISESPRTELGVNTNKKTKRIGCNALKTLIENDQLFIIDWDILQELARFVKHKTSYAAEEGEHDDLVMCLVIFGWVTTQPYFKELTNTDLRASLMAKKAAQINDDLLFFGVVDNGEEEETLVVDLVSSDFDRFMMS